jgi:hypothetical protein
MRRHAAAAAWDPSRIEHRAQEAPVNEPHDEAAAPGREVTLTDEEIETRALGDAGQPRPMARANTGDTGDDTGDTGDDSGDPTDTSDTGDDSGDVSDTGDDSGDSGGA